MVWLLIQILLVAWVPGALLLRLPGRSRAYRAALPADERLFWTVLLSVVWSTTVAVLLGEADRYTFDRLLAINAVMTVLALVAARHHITLPRPVTRLSVAALVPAAIIGLGLWLYFPPSEYIIGGKDPGTYLNEGVQIAQRGQTVIRDPVVAGVPEPLRDLFFPAHGQSTYYSLRFMGFFIQDPDVGAVVGQFPHFYPASVAIGYGLNGLSGARQAIGVWALLGLMAVYFTGVRLFGRTAAGAAVLLLTINVVMVWFGRYPNSELPMQALLFAALLAAGRARDGGGAFFAATAGALLGVTLFLRVEVLFAIVAFAAAAVLVPVARQRLGAGFVVALIATSVAGGWYLTDTMRAYVALHIGFVSNRGGWLLIVGGALAAIVAHRVLRLAPVGPIVRTWLPRLMALAIIVLAGYAYFIRDEGGRTALGDAMAFRTFGWYVTPWGLALAVAGAAWFVLRDLWRDPTFYLTFVTFSTFFFYKTRIVPEHFWTSRRFLGVALPGAMLLMAAIVQETVKPARLARLGAKHPAADAAAPSPPRLAELLSVVLVLAILAPVALAYWRASRPVSHHVEYAGVIPQLEQLAARVNDRDLLLVEARNAGTDLHVLAMPLAYIYARNVLVLESAAPDKRAFEQFVTWAHTRYDRVLFLGGGGTDLLTRTTGATPLGGTRFQVPEYDSPVNAYPRAVHAKEFEYGLYQLTAGTTTAPGPIDLQIGGADDLNVVRFHARERNDADGLVYRWTGPQSFILLTGLHPAARELTVWMSHGGRPASAPSAVVEVALDDEVLGTATATSSVLPFTFALPGALVERLATARDPVRLRLRVPTWSPAAALGTPDTRDLGVMVTRVQVP
jgi:4-amino-4-deoxy-L-arabinose transferase-like glycosyltransferase